MTCGSGEVHLAVSEQGADLCHRVERARKVLVFIQPAESARAVAGRRCPHSGRGEDFLSCQPDFFTETAVTPERKVEKWFPRWEINRHAEG